VQSGLLRAAPAPGNEGVVRITAVVTGPRGELISGLKATDFELSVDGTPQAIDSVEHAGAAAAPRTLAFLLDEFHTDAGDSVVVRESLLRFVDRHLRAGDLAMVVKPLDPLTAIAATADREAVRSAISTFEGRKGDYTPRTVFERNYMAQAPNAVAAARAQIVTSALRTIGMSLSDRKTAKPAIVLVSDGFARMRSSREVPANLQTAIRIFNRADAPIYAFAPALTAPPAGATEPPDPAFTALAELTTQTGGALVTGTAALEAGLSRIARDLEGHYVLTYRAAHGSDGRFHALQVGIKRRGAQVHARTGYVAPMPAEMRAATSAPSAPLRVLRRSALIQSWSGIAPTTSGRARVAITWEPAAPRAGAPARGRAASIVITASAPDGTTLFDAAVAPVGAPEGPDVARFESAVGPVRVDMKILDAKGVVIDTDARDITIPAPRQGSPTIYPAEVLRARSAREFRDLTADPDAAPVPAREFRRTERLLIRVPAVDASGQSAPVSAVLLNRLRQPMRELPPMPGGAPTTSQFDLPLAHLAPGDYSVRLSVPAPGGMVSEFVTFRVGG
jgi:VWFA-related protein